MTGAPRRPPHSSPRTCASFPRHRNGALLSYSKQEYLDYWPGGRATAKQMWNSSHTESQCHRLSYSFHRAKAGSKAMADAWNNAPRINKNTNDPFRHPVPCACVAPPSSCSCAIGCVAWWLGPGRRRFAGLSVEDARNFTAR